MFLLQVLGPLSFCISSGLLSLLVPQGRAWGERANSGLFLKLYQESHLAELIGNVLPHQCSGVISLLLLISCKALGELTSFSDLGFSSV